MLASPLRSTTKSELSLMVCFFGPPEEDDALFGVVASEATRAFICICLSLVVAGRVSCPDIISLGGDNPTTLTFDSDV